MVRVLFGFFFFFADNLCQVNFPSPVIKNPSSAAHSLKANTPETSGKWKGKFVFFRKVVG